MIEEGDIDQNALLSDDEIAVKSMRLGFGWHYPGRIRIQQILHESFKCDWKRRSIITELIVYYGLGVYADPDQSDLLIKKEAADALQDDDPIGYLKKLRLERQRPFIQATNAIVGDNNQGVVQGQDFRFSSLDIKSKNDMKQIPTQRPKKKSGQDIWDKIKHIAGIIGGIGAIVAAASKYFELW